MTNLIAQTQHKINQAGFYGTLVDETNDNGHVGWLFTFNGTHCEDDALAVLDIMHDAVPFESNYSDFDIDSRFSTTVMIAA